MSRVKRAKTAARQGQVISDDPKQVRMTNLRRWKVASQSVPGLWYTNNEKFMLKLSLIS